RGFPNDLVAGGTGPPSPNLPVLTRDDAGLDRQFHRTKAQRLFRDLIRDAIDLEHDTAGMHAGGPEIDRSLTFTHPHFRRLRGNRHIREDPDPDPALTLHVTGDRAAGRFDLAGGNTLGLIGFQTMRTEIQV